MHHRYQCFCLDEIITRFNYVLRINQIFALFDQILNFTLKHRAKIQWICSYIDIPMGLHLIMIDLHGQISIDERLYEKLVLTTSRRDFFFDFNRRFLFIQPNVHLEDSKRLIDANGIVQWLIRLMRRMSTRCFNEFESIEIYLNEINKNQSDRRVIEQIIKVKIFQFTCLIDSFLLRNVETMSFEIFLILSIHQWWKSIIGINSRSRGIIKWLFKSSVEIL